MNTTIRSVLLGLCILSSVGCARAYVRSFDKETVTVCAKPIVFKDVQSKKMLEEAQGACGTGRASMIGGFQNREISGYSQGMPGFTGRTINTEYKIEECFVYRCGS